MRLAVFCDHPYRRDDDGVSAEQPFSLFIAGLAEYCEKLVVIGRLQPGTSAFPYRLASDVGFVALPFYRRLSNPLVAMRALLGSLRVFWGALDDLDVVWLLGPHPLSVAFAALAAARHRRVVLGVRQDFPRYVRHRHPTRRGLYLAALLLEKVFRSLGRRCTVVAVGPELARHYRNAQRVLPLCISLVHESEIGLRSAAERDYDGPLTILSVGRLDAEKNPLLLADVLALLRMRDDRWRLIVCGEGALRDDLANRSRQLGVADTVDLRGHVPITAGLRDLYLKSHVLLHVSWTEGMPQVLLEAFAARLPVVATAVGGVAEVAGDAAVLIPPGDAEQAAAALQRIAHDPGLRETLDRRGLERLSGHTLEAECRRLARFLGDQSRSFGSAASG